MKMIQKLYLLDPKLIDLIMDKSKLNRTELVNVAKF